jgi:hypothetical protein
VSITAILLITTLTITVTTNIQPVFAPRTCGQCGLFLKLTAQFEKAVIGAVQPPEPDKIGQFRQLTGQFKSDVINAVLSNPPEPDKIFGLLNSYDDGVERIFLGGPDTIPVLLQDYGRNVFEVFGLGPR